MPWRFALSRTVVPAVALLTLLAGCGKDAPNAATGAASGSDAERAEIGLKIAPVPLNTQGLDTALVGLGSYLVNASGGCNDCHTVPNFAAGGDPYKSEKLTINAANYLQGGRQFGPVTSRNLTPKGAERLPAGLSFAQFKWMMQTGEDPKDSRRVLQVMPWPIFGHMREGDLRAIYEFLRAIPALPDSPAPQPAG
ncbi:MAG: cytochrome C [bacterium]